ncbi:hypothetical protein J4734_20020 [Klebsiella pneumoniae]|uniref:Uncharacterized protein n=1 Tax=Klebsiella pneumoniae TaxID=573 RepID=A0A939NQ94_KLEPN|nr:hypothetical protein [Klebsiella pneumoniae]
MSILAALERPTAAPGSISGTIRVDVAGNCADPAAARAAAVSRPLPGHYAADRRKRA